MFSPSLKNNITNHTICLDNSPLIPSVSQWISWIIDCLIVPREQKFQTPDSCSLHRSKHVDQVAYVRKSWLSTVDLVDQRSSFIKEQLSQWAAYRTGLRPLRKLLWEVDPLLPPAGPLFCVLHREHTCYQVGCDPIWSVGTITLQKCGE